MSNKKEKQTDDEIFIKLVKAHIPANKELDKLKSGEKTTIDCPICGEKMLIVKMSNKGHVIRCGCGISMS